MTHYRNSTQTPNELFDVLLKTLSGSELKVLMFIIRRTIGQVDPDDPTRRKERTWITQSLFSLACALSGRAVSSAIDSLVKQSLIEVTDKGGRVLTTKRKRRGASRLFFASRLRLESQHLSKASEVDCQNPVTIFHTIKLNQIKVSCYNSSQGTVRLSDVQRFKQIVSTLNSPSMNKTK